MCSGVGCELKEKCHRFISKASEYRQSYFTKPPVAEDGSCVMFWGESANSILDQLNSIVNTKKESEW
jgi:hypothetical protein